MWISKWLERFTKPVPTPQTEIEDGVEYLKVRCDDETPVTTPIIITPEPIPRAVVEIIQQEKSIPPQPKECELCGTKFLVPEHNVVHLGKIEKTVIEGYLPFKCSYCGGTFCDEHRLPEYHNCKVVNEKGWCAEKSHK